MTEPTPEQIKEFWDYFKAPYWAAKHEVVFCSKSYVNLLATIDLNNLFRWAVPELFFVSLQHSGAYPGAIEDYYVQASKEFADNHCYAGNSPALALFWAIWEVIHA